MPRNNNLSRRTFVATAAAGAAVSALPKHLFAQVAGRPEMPYGIQSGDVTADSAVVWGAADRPSRMRVEWSTTESFKDSVGVPVADALPETGLTGKVALTGLPAGTDIFYRVAFQNMDNLSLTSEPMVGRLRTARTDRRSISFVFSGDTAGQGWGINLDWGGMRTYETMRQLQPDFFIHSGDMIYADGPLQEQVELPDGTIWKNVIIPEKTKVAETVDEFRGQYKYNLMDENVRRFNAEVSMYPQWDDHEVTNNWFHARRYDGDDRYTENSAAVLAARAKRAMFEYTPLSVQPAETDRVYRAFDRGPLLEVFRIDLRSYRSPNNDNTQTALGPDARALGPTQIQWLKRRLLNSRATWKIIASDMPIGLVVFHDFSNRAGSEAIAQGDGPPLGRELEFADLLRFVKLNDIKNVHFVTADVHYCATHFYNPNNAVFQDFNPFFEFVSGPLHAGGFGPNELDNTFGPEVVFTKNPGGTPNTPPTSGGLYFGHAAIDGDTGVMTVSHRDVFGNVLWERDLSPEI